MQTSSAGSALLQAALLKTSTQQEQVCAARTQRARTHPLQYPAPMDLEEQELYGREMSMDPRERCFTHPHLMVATNAISLACSHQQRHQLPRYTRLAPLHPPLILKTGTLSVPLHALNPKALGFSPTSCKRRALHVHTQSGEKKWRVSAWVPSCFILVCSFSSKSALPVLQHQLE